jgi:hypothetical protein
MNIRHHFLAAMSFLSIGCHAQPQEKTAAVSTQLPPLTITTTIPKEKLTMTNDDMPAPSRPCPPEVKPITHKGVRYEQDAQSSSHGGTQPGGYLVAINPETGERLWMLKVYEVRHQPDAPFEPGCYFRSMRLLRKTGEIEIVNEVGGKYLVNLTKRTSTWISGPDSNHKQR